MEFVNGFFSGMEKNVMAVEIYRVVYGLREHTIKMVLQRGYDDTGWYQLTIAGDEYVEDMVDHLIASYWRDGIRTSKDGWYIAKHNLDKDEFVVMVAKDITRLGFIEMFSWIMKNIMAQFTTIMEHRSIDGVDFWDIKTNTAFWLHFQEHEDQV